MATGTRTSEIYSKIITAISFALLTEIDYYYWGIYGFSPGLVWDAKEKLGIMIHSWRKKNSITEVFHINIEKKDAQKIIFFEVFTLETGLSRVFVQYSKGNHTPRTKHQLFPSVCKIILDVNSHRLYPILNGEPRSKHTYAFDMGTSKGNDEDDDGGSGSSSSNTTGMHIIVSTISFYVPSLFLLMRLATDRLWND